MCHRGTLIAGPRAFPACAWHDPAAQIICPATADLADKSPATAPHHGKRMYGSSFRHGLGTASFHASQRPPQAPNGDSSAAC